MNSYDGKDQDSKVYFLFFNSFSLSIHCLSLPIEIRNEIKGTKERIFVIERKIKDGEENVVLNQLIINNYSMRYELLVGGLKF